MRIRRDVLILAAALTLSGPAFAVQPDEILKEPVLEQRARDISSGLRCLVCQNQSIDDSDAPLARDLRVLVRERLKAGDTDTEVRNFVVSRYGDFILLRPPVRLGTALLWFSPLVILLAAAFGLAMHLRRRRQVPGSAPPLSRDEQAALDAILKGQDGGRG